MQLVRKILIAAGIATMLWGAYLLVTTQRVDQLIGLALWMLGAIILHDAVLSPVIFFANVLLRREGKRVPWSVLVVIQIAVVIGSVLTLMVAPEIAGQMRGAVNPTILTGDYATRLALMWAVLLVFTAVASAVLILRGRRRNAQLASVAVD